MNKHGHNHQHQSQVAVLVDAVPAKDPVCGMMVMRNQGRPSCEHKGQIYHFCSLRCHDKFAADPERFLSGKNEQARVSLPLGTQYTCPMHPKIVLDEPGDCPICGMALEAMRFPAVDQGPNPELVDFERRVLIGAVLTMGPFVRARRLARATMHNIKQNLFFALVNNAAGVPVAAGALYPFLGVLISPIFAAAAMSLSSLSVVSSALRLRSVRM